MGQAKKLKVYDLAIVLAVAFVYTNWEINSRDCSTLNS
jgi:hypothetical protein